VTFDEMQDAYQEQVRGLIDGGCDILLPETVFDTLTLKAACAPSRRSLPRRTWPCQSCCQEPSPTKSGRLMSGQTVDAFYASIKHARPLAVGLNCGGGAPQLRPYIEDLAGQADEYILCYPMRAAQCFRGLRRAARGTATLVGELARAGLATSWADVAAPRGSHSRDRAGRARRVPAASSGTTRAALRLAGLDTLTVRPESNFILIGERTNVSGSKKFANLIKAGDFAAALAVALEQVRGGANV